MRVATRAAALLTAGTVLVALSGCSSSASAPGVTATTIKVGTHAPLTGVASAGYKSISAATKAYFAYVNAKGGVGGRKIVYDVKDDAYDPQKSVTAVHDLVEKDKVFAIVGGLGTQTHAAVVDYLNKEGVPDLFVASGSPQWNEPKKHPWTFGFNADYIVEGKVLASYAQANFLGKRYCVLGQDDDLGKDLSEGLTEILGPSGLATTQTYKVGDEDLTSQVAALKSAGCEVTFLGTVNAYTAMALATAAKTGFTTQWMSTSTGGDYTSVSTLLGSDGTRLMAGFLSADFLQYSAGNDWTQLFQQINQKYGEGAAFDGNTFLGMSIAYTFVEALAKTGDNPTRQGLVDTLQSGRVIGNGIMPLTFSASNHSAYNGAGITTVLNGIQSYVGHPYLAAHGGSQVVDYLGKGVLLDGDGIPKA